MRATYAKIQTHLRLDWHIRDRNITQLGVVNRGGDLHRLHLVFSRRLIEQLLVISLISLHVASKGVKGPLGETRLVSDKRREPVDCVAREIH